VKGKRALIGADGGIISEGVAQVIEGLGNPLSSRASRIVGESVLFVALQFISARFAALL
jgi:hypothetical protein